MYEFETLIKNDGERNVTLVVSGCAKYDENAIEVLDLKKLKQPHAGLKGLRLDSATWLIEEKATIRLWWGQKRYVLSMESRNNVPLKGIETPPWDDWSHIIYMDIVGVVKDNYLDEKRFMFILELDKL